MEKMSATIIKSLAQEAHANENKAYARKECWEDNRTRMSDKEALKEEHRKEST